MYLLLCGTKNNLKTLAVLLEITIQGGKLYTNLIRKEQAHCLAGPQKLHPQS